MSAVIAQFVGGCLGILLGAVILRIPDWRDEWRQRKRTTRFARWFDRHRKTCTTCSIRDNVWK